MSTREDADDIVPVLWQPVGKKKKKTPEEQQQQQETPPDACERPSTPRESKLHQHTPLDLTTDRTGDQTVIVGGVKTVTHRHDA